MIIRKHHAREAEYAVQCPDNYPGQLAHC
jgi:hypothetical protein